MNENKQNELVTSVLTQVSLRGIRKATLRHIAKGAGVTIPALYNYYSSKTDALRCAVDHASKLYFSDLMRLNNEKRLTGPEVLMQLVRIRYHFLRLNLWWDYTHPWLSAEMDETLIDLFSKIQKTEQETILKIMQNKHLLTTDERLSPAKLVNLFIWNLDRIACRLAPKKEEMLLNKLTSFAVDFFTPAKRGNTLTRHCFNSASPVNAKVLKGAQ